MIGRVSGHASSDAAALSTLCLLRSTEAGPHNVTRQPFGFMNTFSVYYGYCPVLGCHKRLSRRTLPWYVLCLKRYKWTHQLQHLCITAPASMSLVPKPFDVKDAFSEPSDRDLPEMSRSLRQRPIQNPNDGFLTRGLGGSTMGSSARRARPFRFKRSTSCQ